MSDKKPKSLFQIYDFLLSKMIYNYVDERYDMIRLYQMKNKLKSNVTYVSW